MSDVPAALVRPFSALRTAHFFRDSSSPRIFYLGTRGVAVSLITSLDQAMLARVQKELSAPMPDLPGAGTLVGGL